MIGIDKTLFASASSKLNSMFLVSANQRLQTLVALLMFIESVQSDLTCYAGRGILIILAKIFHLALK